MTSSSQIYETFCKDASNTELTATKKDEFIRNVKKLDERGNELLFILIKIHELKATDNPNIPYEGKLSSDEIKFDMENIPGQLQHILYKFVSAHIKSLEEDTKLDQERRSIVTRH